MRVSVVIPTYNRAMRISVAIDSVLRQATDGVEIVVVDDGSTDNTEETVARYGDRVRYIRQSNAGAGSARNTGLRHATGEFVAFLDSDDRWEEGKLSVQLALLEARPEVGLVFSDFVIEKPDGSRHPRGASLWAGRDLDFPEMRRMELVSPRDDDGRRWPVKALSCWTGPMYRQLLHELPILTSSVIIRRAALDATTWFAEGVVLFEDWYFFAQVARRAPVGYVDYPTTTNVGHLDPGRVSRCSSIDRAVSYQALLERVWLSDAEFVARWPMESSAAYSRALLAVAREALLAGRRDLAWNALRRRRGVALSYDRGWATILAACTRMAGGRIVLRNLMRGRRILRLLSAADSRFNGSVNPAA